MQIIVQNLVWKIKLLKETNLLINDYILYIDKTCLGFSIKCNIQQQNAEITS